MFAHLRENLGYKLLALGFAIALHYYVVAQEPPPPLRTVRVQLTPRDLPPNLLFDQKVAPRVSVTLTGPADVLSHVADADVTASVDLSRARAGKNAPTPVQVTLQPGESGLVIDVQPAAVSLTLSSKAKRRLTIAASDPGTPPAGFVFHAAQITPRYATVEGPQEAVASVKQVVANVEAGRAVGTIDNDFSLVALDQQGAQVNGLTLTPTSAHVLIKMDRVPSSRTLFVDANVTGAPAYPYKVTGVDVSPQTVTVAGRPEVLSAVGSVLTEPINVSGATADVTRKVNCVTPPGLAVSGSKKVTVTVHIVSEPASIATPPPLAAPKTPIGAKPQ